MGARGNRSVTFNNTGASVKDKLAQQMKELEEKKTLAEQAVKAAEAKKSSDSTPAPTTIAA